MMPVMAMRIFFVLICQRPKRGRHFLLQLTHMVHIFVMTHRHSGPCPNEKVYLMKVFKSLSPRQIARHVKSFHRGSFMVEEMGLFEFTRGEITLENLRCNKTLSLATRVNRVLRGLRQDNLLLG
jgi:hypothetical protein